MIHSKKFDFIAIGAMLLAVLSCLAIMNRQTAVQVSQSDGESAETGRSTNRSTNVSESAAEPEYVEKLFGSDLISIEILAEESDWQTMLDNAMKEEYIMADVIINGTKFQNVGVRPKGNSSLTQVSASDSDRYSFRIKFDEYIKGQTCFGLESFVVNNMIGDNTYMKEYISYDLMTQIGVDAPCFGFANISLNGENWGLYLAVELYNDSYKERVYGDTSGMLYNVKSMEMGQGQEKERPQQMPDFESMPKPQEMQEEGQTSEEQISEEQISEEQTSEVQTQDFGEMMKGKEGGFPGGFGGSSGGSLQYIDDDTDSYSSIFGNVVGKGSESDYERVIEALEALSKGEELETYFDVDKILRYLAAHTIVVNLDSYSSSMAQNYYLYERDGVTTILPWDYNLAWGGFQNDSASSVVNFPIDTPVSGVGMSDRPLIEKLFANNEYLERYHSYLQELITSYFSEGKFRQKVEELDQLISQYVKQDPTAFCTYEEYEKAVSSFITLGELRSESVQGQLDQTIPSTTEGQQANPDLLIGTGNLAISDLGTMMGGKGDGERGAMGRPEQSTSVQSTAVQSTVNTTKTIERQAEPANTEEVAAEAASSETVNSAEMGGFPGMSGEMGQLPGMTGEMGRNPMEEGSGIDTNLLLILGISIGVLLVSLLAAAKWKRCY